MAKTKTETTETPVVAERSAAYTAQKAMYDKYAKQNPVKYELKKAAFEKTLSTL